MNPYAKMVSELNKYAQQNPKNTKIIRQRRQKARAELNSQLLKHGKSGKQDGTQPNQATRMAIRKDHSGADKVVKMVCDLFYAAWIVIDELHSAGSGDTITYTQIIDPMNKLDNPELTPSHTAITGSALANGITTTMVFAAKALRRHTWATSDNLTIRKLSEIDMKEMTKV